MVTQVARQRKHGTLIGQSQTISACANPAFHRCVPLATVHDAVLDFPHGRDDAALFGAQPRMGLPKAFTDRRDLAVLLLRFPDLKAVAGPVRVRLEAGGASESDLAAWAEVVAQEIREETDSEEFE